MYTIFILKTLLKTAIDICVSLCKGHTQLTLYIFTILKITKIYTPPYTHVLLGRGSIFSIMRKIYIVRYRWILYAWHVSYIPVNVFEVWMPFSFICELVFISCIFNGRFSLLLWVFFSRYICILNTRYKPILLSGPWFSSRNSWHIKNRDQK